MWINNDAGLQIGHADMAWRREVRVWLLSLMWRYSNMKILRDIFALLPALYWSFGRTPVFHSHKLSLNS